MTVRVPKTVIRQRMKKLDQNIAQTNLPASESLLAGWERVYAIFQQKQQQGLISWPKQGKIRVMKAQKIYEHLA